MDTKALVKLAASGNTRDVEETWLNLLESDSTPEEWIARAAVLQKLSKKGKSAEGEVLATTALEFLAGVWDQPQLLAMASAFLLAVKDGSALRQAVANLYREIHADVPGLESLLEEAGVEQGRPPRRALRTMNVCLDLKEGMFLSHRHEDLAARVEHVDRAAWHIDLNTGTDTQSLGAVDLADNFEIAGEDDFRVMAQFAPERWSETLRKDPATALTDVLRRQGQTVDSDTLRRTLSPRFIPSEQWTKWWTKARQALRFSPHVRIEGRSPYFLSYDEAGTTFQEEIEARLARAHDPVTQLTLAEEYVRGCKPRKQTPDLALLRRIRERIEGRARQTAERTGKVELVSWLAAQRVAELAGEDDAGGGVVEALCQADDPVAAILEVQANVFWAAACDALEQAHPHNLADALQRLLPHAPVNVANHLAERLIELACPPQRFHELAERILRDPVRFNEGLLWLWSGRAPEGARVTIPPVTILTRILHALGDLKHHDDIPKERSRHIALSSREALKAGKYERFRQVLGEIEPGVAAALRTQIARLDNLGRANDDMTRLIREKFPQLNVVRPQLPKWLQDDVLFVTDEGHRRKHQQIEELVNVKMRENAEAIGNAAARGDLSENSEYKFALEERDLLRARLAQIQRETEIARILTINDVPDNHVGIGCRAVLEHVKSNARQVVTILGPWEADPDQGIFNYLTPVAQAILGKPAGETCTVDFFDPPGEYRVTEITCALPDDSPPP